MVCALIESRAREVGLAAVQWRSMEFEVMQFNDSSDYSRTVAAVLALEPAAVVLSRTARGTQLMRVLDQALQHRGLPAATFVERRHFDETEGESMLSRTSLLGLQATDLRTKFVACAAFTALFRYLESTADLRVNVRAARVVFRGAAHSMAIDSSTARLLELVADARGCGERGSMAGLFTCRTPGGSRLLRQSLLQPPASKDEIESRQEAVEALLGSEELFYELQRLLPAVGDMDLLVARFAVEPKTRGPQWCKAAIRTSLRLRQALAALPQLAAALRTSADSRLLREAKQALTFAKFPQLLEELDRVLDTETPPCTSGSAAYTALMYAVRPSVSPLLDIARQTWSEALEQIHALHRSYATRYPELHIRLEFTEKRGWYLSHAAQGVPPEFQRTAQKGSSSRLQSTTAQLSSENFKLRQAEKEVLQQTLLVLGTLFQVLQQEAPHLYEVSSVICTLDLIQAFVGYTLLLGDCVRPAMSDDASAPIAIKAGRHPLKEKLGLQAFAPVDFFIDEACHFQSVTGQNGAGKSTYLQTLAQLVVLAQIGCFIPAKFATIRIVTSLFTRIGTSDNIEACASTFLVEMMEAAHILRDAEMRSLVLIDELGRGTAHADGLAICWAVCEKLLEKRVYCLFATHFFEICRLQLAYPSFRNMHLAPSDTSAEAKYQVHHVTSLDELQAKANSHYGIMAAERAGLPRELLELARGFAAKVQQRLALQLPTRPSAMM